MKKMVSYLHVNQQSILQNSIFDALYCDEEHFDDDLCSGSPEIEGFDEPVTKKPLSFLFEHDLLWDDDELISLLAKERKDALVCCDEISIDGSLRFVRDEAVKWMLKVISHHGFNPITAVLAVNFYDRSITSVSFQRDKPWMSQLAAVACVSIAAKVEETQVPLLLDLQVEESKYLFEAKTIQRMELLVLSTLQWKMNPVTPISFIDHIARRFKFVNNLNWEFLSKCEALILSIITDCRLVHYLPSVIAAATVIHVIKETENCCVRAQDCQNQIMRALLTSKEKVDECLKLIEDIMSDHHSHKPLNKRKYKSIPSSPSGVIDAYINNSDSSVDSWAVTSSLTSPPEPLLKRSRVQEQHIR